jgi:hypothetical protein
VELQAKGTPCNFDTEVEMAGEHLMELKRTKIILVLVLGGDD